MPVRPVEDVAQALELSLGDRPIARAIALEGGDIQKGGQAFGRSGNFPMQQAAIRRRPARANPWGAAATTLEWTLPSPPPFHQFNELPVIHADSH